MENRALRWGILSAGKIAHDFSIAFQSLLKEEHEIIAVGTRNLSSAEIFAKEHSIPKAYGSYTELIEDPKIDIIYIGTLHPHHLKWAKYSLENGKHVLCEKPLCMNVKETKELLEYAKEKKLFLMEAIWSRFFPVFKRLIEELGKGTIGDVIQVIASLGFPFAKEDLRFFVKEMGGGSVIDLGLYCVQLSTLVFGREMPLKISSSGHLNEDGVDQSSSTTLIYPNGKTSSFVTHTKAQMPNEAFIIGTKGTIKLEFPFWCPTKLTIKNESEDCVSEEYSLPINSEKSIFFWNTHGLFYQCNEVRRCILNGETQSPVVSHEETLLISQIIESIRKQIGVVYDQDD